MDQLHTSFEQAAEWARTSLPRHLDGDVKLALYSLYKQATLGDCVDARPSMWNLTSATKWDAWKDKAGLDRGIAMRKYIDLVDSLSGTTPSSSSPQDEGSLCSGRVSTMAEAQGDEYLADDKTELMEAACLGALDRIEAAIGDLETVDSEGRTALHWAADRGQVEACARLLAAGAKVDAMDESRGTSLAYAVICEHVDVIRLLIGAGADPLLRATDGESPLSLASPDIQCLLQASRRR